MITDLSKNRLYPSLLILGSSILLFRTIHMISAGAYKILILWVFILLIAEFLIDVGCLMSSIFWWISNDASKASIPLRFVAAAALFHAFRVLIFVLGRSGPWINFDVRPEHRALHFTRWTWPEVYFAAIMSVLGIIGVIIIWQIRRKKFSQQ